MTEKKVNNVNPKNVSGRVEYAQHPEHGMIVRGKLAHNFRQRDLAQSRGFCRLVDWRQIPDSMIRKNREKKNRKACSKCGGVFP